MRAIDATTGGNHDKVQTATRCAIREPEKLHSMGSGVPIIRCAEFTVSKIKSTSAQHIIWHIPLRTLLRV